MKTEIKTIPVDDLLLLEVNARYMRHETFQQLVANIKKDGVLTQLPFAVLERDVNRYRVLSGNHRVKAAKEAGLTEVQVLVTDEPMDKAQRLAIQLSHNAIAGEDDPVILKTLYDEIDNIDWRMYAGLDDKTLELLAKVQPESLSEVNLQFQNVSIVFLPDELEDAKAVIDEALALVKGMDEVWLARWKDYDTYMEAMETTSKAINVRNTATVFHGILNVFRNHQTDLRDGWIDEETWELRHKQWIPLSTVFGTDSVPAPVAALLLQVVNRMEGHEEIGQKNRWQALEYMAAEYLSGDTGG